MSTRFSKEREDGVSVATGYEGYNIPEDEFIPPCTIEDVDRAVFTLFNKDLPMVYSYKEESKRIPVIFATGERFAVLRRKRPLRDKHGALILPLVSIMRSGIAQDVDRGMGPGQNAPITIIFSARALPVDFASSAKGRPTELDELSSWKSSEL